MAPPAETDQTLDAGGAKPAAVDGTGPAGNLGRYRLDGTLGQGGMGVVYRAHDPELERQVALKVLRGTHGGAARARLLREARAMAQLQHPNVVTVFEVGFADGRDFVAMELIDGSSVDSWLRTKRTLDQVLDVFVQAARGLAAAHAKGLVHRDFKPHNVLVARDGLAIVTDFGLARAADAEEDAQASPLPELPATPPTGFEATVTPTTSGGTPRAAWASTLTATGALVGTPAYMAPEQWSGGVVDPRTDQFSFCVALWEAASGERPFAGTDLESLRASVFAGPPAAASGIPAWLDAILRRGLALKAAERWPSIDALIAAIAHGRAAPQRRRRNAVIGAFAAVVIVSIAVFALTRGSGSHRTLTTSSSSPPAPPPPPAPSSAFEERVLKHLAALMTLPSAPGNAGEEYLSLMRADATIDARFSKAMNADERPRLEALARDPVVLARLDRMRRGAAMRDCTLMGPLVPWATGPDPFVLEFPTAAPLLAHAGVLRFIAAEKAKAGRIDEAKRDLEAILWIGWHLQKEPLLLYNMVGVAFSADVSEQLAELETDSTRAGRWRVLAGLFRGRRYEDYADRRGDLEATAKLEPGAMDRLVDVVDNPDALLGARAESMRLVGISHLLAKTDMPPSDQQRSHMARWARLDDARLRDVAVRLGGIFELDAAGRAAMRKVYEEHLH